MIYYVSSSVSLYIVPSRAIAVCSTPHYRRTVCLLVELAAFIKSLCLGVASSVTDGIDASLQKSTLGVKTRLRARRTNLESFENLQRVGVLEVPQQWNRSLA